MNETVATYPDPPNGLLGLFGTGVLEHGADDESWDNLMKSEKQMSTLNDSNNTPLGVVHLNTVSVDDAIRSIGGWRPEEKMWVLDRITQQLHHKNVIETLSNYLTEHKPGGFKISDGLADASSLPASKTRVRLWFGIYPGRVTLLNGETGAGKSVVLLNVAVHAALNEPLWNVPFGLGRPVRVLYIDPENSGNFKEGDGGIVTDRLARLGKGRPDGLMIHNGQGMDLSNPEHTAQLRMLLQERKIDLLILDPYANLFNTENENDNREAYTNMNVLNMLARDTGVAIVLCHHTGKVGEDMGGSSAKFGRGASSLLGAADVGMTLRVRRSGGESESDEEGAESGDASSGQRSDVCRLKVEKNRVVGQNNALYLQMAGNEQFKRVTYAEYFDKTDRATQTEKAMQKARELFSKMLNSNDSCTRTEMIEAAKALDVGRPSATQVLAEMEAADELVKENGTRGCYIYRRPESSKQQATSL